jgi:hypothetical protein
VKTHRSLRSSRKDRRENDIFYLPLIIQKYRRTGRTAKEKHSANAHVQGKH